MESVDIFAMVAGACVALIAFFGCCGAYKENTCLLTTYSTALIALVIVELALAVVAFLVISGRSLGPDITRHLNDMYDDKEINQSYMDILNTVQRYFECCGIVGSRDMKAFLRKGTLMDSCCEPKFAGHCMFSNAYKDGCQPQIKEFLEKNFKIIGGVAVAVGVAEMIGAALAICVKRKIIYEQAYI
ncbi:unnamed protein product [Acanthoscelides obtectus]|nr:unnamed protein product [Acanthoscelides obtectus]CAK1675203.1 CD63 antigen [Acanthoscelides obtectus]